MRLAERIQRIQPSATLAISAKARNMRAEGIDVISFGSGEPDFDTPQHIKDAAVKALVEGHTKYTAVAGIDELKEAICRRAQEDYGLKYGPAQVITCCGAKHAIYNAAMVLFEPGDEVLLVAPFWVSYPDILTLTGATPVILRAQEDDGFKITAQQIRDAVTPKTRALIFNSPCNPTGATYRQHELEEIGRTVRELGIFVISDDIYDKLLYNDIPPASLASSVPDLHEQVLLVNGVSKTYAMTGWRIGYAIGPEDVIGAMAKMQGQCTSSPTSLAQKAAAAALGGPQTCVREMVAEYDRRRRFVIKRFNEMEGISCFDPEGAFYAFPRVDAYFGKKADGKVLSGPADLADYLLDEAKVAVVPGEPFESDRHFRLSFACSMESIEEGLSRIEKALEKL